MSELTGQKEIAAAIRALEKKQRLLAFDAADPKSRPNKKQEKILREINKHKFRYVVAGNRCNPAESLILMSDGSQKRIVDIRAGDEVFSFNTKTRQLEPSTVLERWDNGKKRVTKYITGVEESLTCTPNHKVLQFAGGKFFKKEVDAREHLVRHAHEFEGRDTESPELTELLGYLLGDGSFSQLQKRSLLRFTNTNIDIIHHVQCLLERLGGYTLKPRLPERFDDFKILELHSTQKANNVINFIRRLQLSEVYAKDKFIPEYVFTQSLKTRRNFIAGMIATDGWMGNDGRIGFSSTSVKLVKGMQRLLASVGVHSNIGLRPRLAKTEGRHQDEYTVVVSKKEHVNKFIKDIHVPGKPMEVQEEFYPYKAFATRKILDRQEGCEEVATYDLTVDHPDHNYICDGYIVSNSGKSQLAARELAWIITDTHPWFEWPEKWHGGKFTAIIACQNLTQGASELWERKVAPFLNVSEWRLEKQGNTLKRIMSRDGSKEIIFVSHTDSGEKNRRNMQGITANYVWLDEMPASTTILDELQARIATTDGRFIATFTPKFRSDAIRRIIDAADGKVSKKYQMSMLDNPTVNKDDEIARLQGQPQAYINTVIYGDWSTGDSAVYAWDFDSMTVDSLPETYNPGWRHVESVDPALRSKCGYTLWAEDPNSGTWYLVSDSYIEGSDALDTTDLFNIIQKRSSGYNICRRISDTMAYYISHAAKHGVTYMTPYSKNNRKEELIKGLQIKLSEGKIKVGRWCTNFIDEIQSCQFSDDSDKIINSSSYHTLDSAQYFCDAIPQYDPSKAVLPYYDKMMKEHRSRIERESMQAKIEKQGQVRTRGPRAINAWRRRGKYRVN